GQAYCGVGGRCVRTVLVASARPSRSKSGMPPPCGTAGRARHGRAGQSGLVGRWAGMDLTCPKCRGAMRTYERSGVTVDQCTECRGIFLDRGELEKLVDAENSYH